MHHMLLTRFLGLARFWAADPASNVPQDRCRLDGTERMGKDLFL